MQNIEAVIVCVGYADFLAETLPHNIHHFDRTLVVTSEKDEETRSLCQRLSVDCRTTDVMYKRGDSFAKGRAIDYGLGYLRRDSWLVHLDADVYLPPTTRHWLDMAELDEECIYGIDRANCVGYDKWQNFVRSGPVHQHTQHCIVVPPPFPLGARISLREHAGYVPIGFFQMWHGKHGRRYPLVHGDAEHTDVLHSLQWPSGNRRLIPEIIGVHLESEVSRMGANWRGRKTARFGRSNLNGSSPDSSYGRGYGS